MDNKELEFFEFAEKEDVCTSEEGLIERVCEVNHPVVIISRPRINESGARIGPRVLIQKPVTFPYKDRKMVSWNYNCNVTSSGEGSLGEEGTKPLVNEPVTEDEGKKILKFLKHSEYSVVEQLHKQPTRTSVLALLQSSMVQRNALMKVLNETYVAEDISVNKLDRLVNNISADNFISFSDDEIPPGGLGSTKALHITTRYKGYTFPGVLIDNGLTLNVLPLSTLNRLPIDSSHMKTCQNIMRAFDGTERKVMGRIEVSLLIRPNTYEVDFLVMDITPSYNYLLERPWIHSAKAIPSSLHQKLKLVTEGWLITINAEEDIIASVTSSALYIEYNDEAVECSFRSLEFVNVTSIIEGKRIPRAKISEATRMGLQLTVGKGALPGRGLGKYLHGRVEVPILADKQDRFGLGYRPDAKQKRREMEMKQKRRRARLRGIIYPEPKTTSEGMAEDLIGSLKINVITDVKEEKWILLHKETIENVTLEEGKEVNIETCITEETRRDLIDLLQEFKYIFAWSYQDMPRLSTDIAVHRVSIKEECKPVQQKLRGMRPDVAVKIRKEVRK
ncbi:uncharacterized protein [Gossypium hirsutum]|uniref:G-patch domain-containing protein n=1 Tax=Gossypium hirsutum TaxID=3635 RepID=A0ABM3C3W3_GOSHI|nr:uncharacterized protein LOC121232319 [Gossypium hirsutum]